jgi:RNA polymerase sigma-70 factor (ECF subfamily)
VHRLPSGEPVGLDTDQTALGLVALAWRQRWNFRVARSLMDLSDQHHKEREWVRLAQAGDRAAFANLVRRHQDAVHRFIMRMLGSREEALELTQETFIKVWQALPQWEPRAQFKTWVFRIASNAATDALRRRRHVEMVPLKEDFDEPAQDPGPDAHLQSRQRLGALESALAALPVEQRQAILLREIEGLSYAEISAVLNVHDGTVKSRIARARETLASAVRKSET